jgi:exosortase family protein XrtF
MKDFAPTIIFLGKFLLVYFLGNILYGLFIESYGNEPDPITFQVTEQSAYLLRATGHNVLVVKNLNAPTVRVISDNREVLNVFEGCNGVNVYIVFLSFVIAFSSKFKRVILFCLFGGLIIHAVNLIRIAALFVTAINSPEFFYYFHKYFFTAILYCIVFALWAAWVLKFDKPLHSNAKVEKG